MLIHRIIFVLFLFFSICITTKVSAQIEHNSTISELATSVEGLQFDGKLDEPFWKDLNSIPFIQFQPAYSKSVSEASDVYLVYDKDYFYLAGRLYVSDPKLIRGQTYKRDGENAGTDYFGLVIDSYNDKENGLAFFTSPTGFRYDAAVSGDASEGNSISTNWNAFWDALTYETESYWDVEIRIPWSSLKFEAPDGNVRMGISIWRYIAAKNEMNLFPDIDPALGEMANWKPSLFHEISMKGVESSKPIYITPYLMVGNQRQHNLNEEGTAFDLEQTFDYNAGLDIKYNLTSNLTLDMTVNTDFAQVESDDEQINLSRYQLFRPEKRQFFQERSDLFDFSFNYVNRLFYSRNIGIEDGQAVPILGGARLTGKVGKMDVGLIQMQTARSNSSFFQGFQKDNISNNYSVLRVKQQVLNPYSYAGAMLTHKMDFKGDYNTTYGLDAVLRVWGNDYLTLKWAQSFEDEQKVKAFSLDNTRFHVGLERRIFSGLSYNMSIGSTGDIYNPEMGFYSRKNYLFSNLNFNYGILFDERSKWRNINFKLGGWLDHNYEISKTDQASVSTGFNLQSKKGWNYNSYLNYSFDILSEELELSDDVSIPIGEYSYSKLSSEINTAYNKNFGLEIEYDFGKYFDGWINSVELEPRWNPNAHLEMGASYELNHIDFHKRDQKLISHIFRFRALYMLNSRFSVSSFLQYNNASDLLISNFRLRYNPREGNDLYLVFNEVLNGDRDRIHPSYPLMNTEVFALKYTYTFKFN